jgi:hypothetical protein
MVKHHSEKTLMTKSAILLGMITMISFALIDSTIFLLSEEKFYDYLNENVDFLDEYTIPILISGASSAISILLAKMVTHYILKEKLNLPINEHPFIDFVGVIIGMSSVIWVYHVIKMNSNSDKSIEDYSYHSDRHFAVV